MKRLTLTLTTIIALISSPALANKSVSLTTYYPAPSGNYDTLDVTSLTVNGQTLSMQGNNELTAENLTATVQLKGPGFTANANKTEITNTLFTKHVNVGGTGTARLKTRHIDGKRPDNAEDDHLFLQYNTDFDVRIGRSQNPSNLLVSGNAGIGINPATNLHVSGTNPTIRFDKDNSGKYFGSLNWNRLHLGNNGENRIVAGRNDANGWLSFYVNATTSTNGTLGIAIKNDGKVGIGTSAPQAVLDVNGNTALHNALIGDVSHGAGYASFSHRLSATGTGYGFMHTSNGLNTYINKKAGAGDISFNVNHVKKVVIDTNGNMGINNTSPQEKLDVTGRIRADYIILDPQNNVHEGAEMQFKGAGSHGTFQIDNYQGNARIHTLANGKQFQVIGGTINTSGSGTNYFNGVMGIGIAAPEQRLHVAGNVKADGFFYSSDERLKDNIMPIKDAVTKVKQLNGVTFDWKKDGSHDVGVIAQNIESVFPELVSTNSEDMKSVKYGNLVAVLIEAVKEQQKQIDMLKAEIEKLK